VKANLAKAVTVFDAEDKTQLNVLWLSDASEDGDCTLSRQVTWFLHGIK